MTCAKRPVECHLHLVDGSVVVGTNACERPQAACPRKPGEGYEKCRTVCGQFAHAEIVALFLVGGYAPGATAVIRGHCRTCAPCTEALVAAGVAEVVFE